MSTLLTINIRNKGLQAQNFFVFQQPAIYSGGGPVYSNSLYNAYLGNLDNTGAELTFRVNLQFYAGIQQTHIEPAVGQSVGYLSASRPIDLTAASNNTAANYTEASVSPVGLSVPSTASGVQPGAFRIATPVYDPGVNYNVGSAVEIDGTIVLSNFVRANPNNNTDCQPVLKYYVQTGQYTPTTVMNFTQSSINAALCDFTQGARVIDVDLNANGTWTSTTKA